MEVQNRGKGVAQNVVVELKCYDYKGSMYQYDTQNLGNLNQGQKGDATLMQPNSSILQRGMIEIRALGGQTMTRMTYVQDASQLKDFEK